MKKPSHMATNVYMFLCAHLLCPEWSVQKTQKITNQYTEVKNLKKHRGFSKMWKIFLHVIEG